MSTVLLWLPGAILLAYLILRWVQWRRHEQRAAEIRREMQDDHARAERLAALKAYQVGRRAHDGSWRRAEPDTQDERRR